MSTIEINTTRLLLRTNCTICNGRVVYPEKCTNVIDLCSLSPAKAEDHGFGIYLNNALIGHIAFVYKRERFELSVGITSAYQKNGYMTEAMQEVLKWLDKNEVDEVWALLGGITNEASRKILSRTGFEKQPEGELEYWVRKK